MTTARLDRDFWRAAALLVLLGLGAALLSSSIMICALAALLAIAGVVLLGGNRWKNGALVVAAVAIAAGLLDLFAGWMEPAPLAHGAAIVYSPQPGDWVVPDPDLGYRPRPGEKVDARATIGNYTVFRVTYTINPDSTRATPPGPAGADTYLFLGDSFIFGQGLDDNETLAAQFAQEANYKVRTVTYAAPGYAPNQFVRALEDGRLDKLAESRVKTVITWIIPDHLTRILGDAPWLGPSPRYVLENGTPRYTGSFDHYRWTNPVAGLRYLANDQFAFVRAIGMRQRQEAETELFTALMLRMQALVREKFGASLIVIYSWPDATSAPDHGDSEVAQPMLVSILEGLRRRGLPLISADDLTKLTLMSLVLIPDDGHPTRFTNQRIAGELRRRLLLAQ